MLDFEGAVVVEFRRALGCKGLVRLEEPSLNDGTRAVAGAVVASVGTIKSPTAIPGCWIVCSSSAAAEGVNCICCSWSLLSPKGVAIPVPGARIGNSSSSGKGIGGPIRPLIEEPVFVRLGPSDFHLPEARKGLIVTDEGFYLLLSAQITQSNRSKQEGRGICICVYGESLHML